MVCLLLNADDVVLIAGNEQGLQYLTFIVENWGKRWRLEKNLTKKNIILPNDRVNLQSQVHFGYQINNSGIILLFSLNCST